MSSFFLPLLVMPQLWSEILSRDRGGLSGENLSIRPDHGKRHIWAMRQGVDILKMVPSELAADYPLSNDPLFKVSEGGPPRAIRIRD